MLARPYEIFDRYGQVIWRANHSPRFTSRFIIKAFIVMEQATRESTFGLANDYNDFR